MTHFTLEIGEKHVGEHCECLDCGAKTILISALSYWMVDQEAFKAGEITSDDPDVPDEVEIGAEVTGHWCNECGVMTSLSFNQ